MIGDRISDQGLKHAPVHVRKLFDVQASLACGVFSESRQEHICLAVAQHAVENQCGLARRKGDQRHVSFTAAVVAIMRRSEANNRRSPEFRFLTRGLLHEFDEFLRVGAARRICQRVEVTVHAEIRSLGLVFRHFQLQISRPKPSIGVRPVVITISTRITAKAKQLQRTPVLLAGSDKAIVPLLHTLPFLTGSRSYPVSSDSA
jgi:hypothetical protein